ncbi:MAG: FecR domain-containing protein [Verrucomicrobiales bacterium]|nr:FecR domain-containing protein [Verrucomicrobiales bacterium]
MNKPQDLIDAYLDDSLTPDDEAELRRWLAADRQNVREFVLAMHQHRCLRSQAQSLRAQAQTEGAPDAAEAASAISRELRSRASWPEPAARDARPSDGAPRRAHPTTLKFKVLLLRRPLISAGLAASLIFLIGFIVFNKANHGVLPELVFDGATRNVVVRPPETIGRRLGRTLARYRFPPLRSIAGWLERRAPSYGPGSVIEVGPAYVQVTNIPAAPLDQGLFLAEPGALLGYTNEATWISLKANTKLKILSARAGKRFELLSGVAEIEAAPQPTNKPLRISTPMATVRVLGTKLALTASGRSTRVSVSEGEVQVESRTTREQTKVARGQRAIAPTNAPVTLHTLRPVTTHYGTGSIRREYWWNVVGRFVQNLTTNAVLQSPPHRVESVSSMEKPDTLSPGEDAYGARYRGYLHPPISGEYTFWVAADDTGEVWLSTDEQPEKKRLICQTREWSLFFRNWWLYPEQESAPIHLEAGRRYYIEALHKEGGGGDFFSVAWQPPGAEMEVISGVDLSPFEPATLASR